MSNKRELAFAVAFFLLSTAFADVLTWRAHEGQQYEAKVTVKESVIGLDTVTTKPALVTVNVYKQEDAAENKSTLPHLNALPAFPRGSVEPGSKWTIPAKIRYDLSPWGHKEPLWVEVPVSYTLVERQITDGKTYYRIRAEWFPFYPLESKLAKRTGIARISGSASMDLTWDNRSGSPKKTAVMEETQYRFTDGSSLLYRKETAEDFKTVTDIVRERIIRQLTEQIATQKVANVEVKQSDEGVVLSMENIQFEANSASLMESEKVKLTNLSKVLSSLKDRKISVVGHAANVQGSSEAELVALSADRAKAVADFLIAAGGRDPASVISSGMGGSVPLGSNDTNEGRMKNRRVEIVILDQEAN
jgi:flagellar motor protein MotB